MFKILVKTISFPVKQSQSLTAEVTEILLKAAVAQGLSIYRIYPKYYQVSLSLYSFNSLVLLPK